MSRAALVKSLAHQVRRKAYRRAQWRRYIKLERAARTPEARAAAHELRAKWSDLHEQATAIVARRRRQLAAKTVETVTDRGLAFLAREEGIVPYAYNDPAGHATFGIGHLIHLGPVTNADRAKWGTPANPKPRSYVMRVFDQDLDKYEAAVRNTIQPKVTKRHRFDAMVSLCFNIGTAGFASSTVARRYNTGQITAAADAFLLWVRPPILRPRRERERALFLTGRYT